MVYRVKDRVKSRLIACKRGMLIACFWGMFGVKIGLKMDAFDDL